MNSWHSRSNDYVDTIPASPHNTVYVACRIAEKFRSRIPTRDELMSEWGMSRATAHRWIRAIKDARALP